MMVKQTIQQEQQQEVIPQELVTKYDGDKELVQEFIKEGYSVEELNNASIIHATKYDPLVTLENGHVAGMWIDSPNENKYNDNSRTYNNRKNKFF